MKTDALSRRSRFAKPQPIDKEIVLTERDYALFEALDRHGKLPTPLLYEFTKHLGRDYKFFQARLTKLYNGAAVSASYLTRDWQQFNNFEARYQPAVYGLSPKAKHALLEAGRGATCSPERNDPFVHQFFGGCFSASFELLAKPHRFISREEILRHTRCPASTREAPNPFAIPVPGDAEMRSLVPDNLIGLEYEDGGYRFFAVEIDRNTETIRPNKPANNSIAKKIRGYSNILANRTYATHFGLPNLTVLFATTNATHMKRMVAYVQEEAQNPRKFLFKSFPSFGDNWKVPREPLDVFAPWQSADGEVDISKKAPS